MAQARKHDTQGVEQHGVGTELYVDLGTYLSVWRRPDAPACYVFLRVHMGLPVSSNDKTTNTKHLLQHTSETSEIFGTYVCNICVLPSQHMQHLNKTVATNA
jgi:hypothetical protein